MKPKVLILKTEGTNCDEELFYAFKIAGGDPKIVHVNELRSKKENLKNYNILAIPGGFSYGDDIVSGKILAVELTSFFSKELKRFIERKDTLIIGVCNGFQVLIRTGLLPFRTIGKMQATLTNNDSGHFDCRWINLKIEKNTSCVFLKDLEGQNVSYQVSHGEGKFLAEKNIIEKLEKEKLVAFRYVDEKGSPTQKYPENPNGSLRAIAGICDITGRILGLMPHPERFVKIEQHPNWRRIQIDKPQGLPIFENMIKYIKNL
ncbi:MAG: phosphoribosylformylglycinamidine synthase I [bacterium]|nr:phosphoribosylformylglycinamidine synthase I [bacterium]